MYKVGDRVLVEAVVENGTLNDSVKLAFGDFHVWVDIKSVHGLAPEKPLAVGDRVKVDGALRQAEGAIKHRIDDHVWVRWKGVENDFNQIHHVQSLTRIKGDS